MRVGEVAALCGISAKTVRYYESIGLVDEPDRTPAGYRIYADTDVERLRFIRDAQATGLSLIEIRSVLELGNHGMRTCIHTRSLLERHLLHIDAQLARLLDARQEFLRLAEEAARRKPKPCVDPSRCRVIEARALSTG